jgi:hypothetical protein
LLDVRDMNQSYVALLVALGLAGPVEAAPVRVGARGDVIVEATDAADVVFARQMLPATAAAGVPAEPAPAQSRIIYLNKDGVTLVPGLNDARSNHSTLVTQPTAIPAFSPPAATWTATVACVRDLFARFDVTVVDADPGDVPHIEAVFAASPGQLGLPDNVGGVSPFTLDCGIIENSVVFTFTQAIPNTPRMLCEVMAQEIAHSYGLDHELIAADPMTYLPYQGDRAFQDQVAACGEFDARACGIGGNVCRDGQNSVALLLERLGARPDTPEPEPDDEAPEPDDGTGTPDAASPSNGATHAGPAEITGGCAVGSGAAGSGTAVGLALLVGARRRRRTALNI